jgi:hypothetical protein
VVADWLLVRLLSLALVQSQVPGLPLAPSKQRVKRRLGCLLLGNPTISKFTNYLMLKPTRYRFAPVVGLALR